MVPLTPASLSMTRRYFFGRTATGIGTAALASLLNSGLQQNSVGAETQTRPGVLQAPHHAPTAKRVIYLFMSVIDGQRLTTMTSGQTRFPIAPSIYKFAQHGQSGIWMSELLPHLAGVADDLTVVKTVHTEAINHDPAITYIQTGSQIPGRPSMGAWLSYGLGSENETLPTFMVLHSTWSAKRDAQALYERLWGSGFLPSRHAGVSLRSQGDPMLYLSNPPGVSGSDRREMLNALNALNQQSLDRIGDPEIETRIAQYEMAYRMQTSIPELADLSDEPQHVLDMYGEDVTRPGTFAANCLLARRLAERNVKFIQVFIRGWDQHGDLPRDLPMQCRDVDQPTAALIQDLKMKGLLEDTLVVWGGEFGRTAYCQGKLSPTNYGRDHHPRCFTMFMAGGGVRAGLSYGKTDDFSYNVVENPVHIHDLNATILHTLGIDHERLTHRFQGRDYRLTDVHGKVMRDLLA